MLKGFISAPPPKLNMSCLLDAMVVVPKHPTMSRVLFAMTVAWHPEVVTGMEIAVKLLFSVELLRTVISLGKTNVIFEVPGNEFIVVTVNV